MFKSPPPSIKLLSDILDVFLCPYNSSYFRQRPGHPHGCYTVLAQQLLLSTKETCSEVLSTFGQLDQHKYRNRSLFIGLTSPNLIALQCQPRGDSALVPSLPDSNKRVVPIVELFVYRSESLSGAPIGQESHHPRA